MLVVDGDKYLVEKEVEAQYGVTIHLLRKLRYGNKKPIYHKLGGKIYYKESHMDEWLKSNLIPSQ